MTYLTYLLASDENAYSTSCEIVGAIDGSMNQVAMHDFEIFKELYDYDFTELEESSWRGLYVYAEGIMKQTADMAAYLTSESVTVSVI